MSDSKNIKDERELAATGDVDDKEEIAHLEGAKGYEQHTTLIEEALALREEEAKLGLWKIFKLYYPGATYGLLLSVALVMEGYDTGLVSLANPAAQPHGNGTAIGINDTDNLLDQ